MKHLLKAVAAAVLLLLLTLIWDSLFGTTISRLLLNVDFIIDYTVRKPSFTEEAAYHIITGVIIYLLLLIIYKSHKYLYLPALIIVLVITCALYYVLTVLAVRPLFELTQAGAFGWLLTHVIYIVVVDRWIKHSSTKSQ